MDNKKKLNLKNDFEPISTKDWEEQIMKDLRGVDYNKKLIWRTLEEFEAKPYYRNEDIRDMAYPDMLPGEFPFVRGNNSKANSWEIRQDFSATDPKSVNGKTIEALNKGADAIGLKICGKIVDSEEKFRALFENIDLEQTPFYLSTGRNTSVFAGYLLKEMQSRMMDIKNAKGAFFFDPIGHLVSKGKFYFNRKEDDFDTMLSMVSKYKTDLSGYRMVGVNGTIFGNAGSTIVQELAFVLSIGNTYLSRMTDAGLPVDDISNSISFRMGVGSNYFMEIAKFRAARYLWAKVVEAYSPKDMKACKIEIHAETTRYNKSIYDPHVNMLRATTEAMSASLGGVKSLSVEPYNIVFAESSDFSERIARNTQIILKEEAYFDKIADPAAGSYYIENLTDSIIKNTWKLFLEIEEADGFINAFKRGIVQAKVDETAKKRKTAMAIRREVLLGTNQYPNGNESVLENIDPSIAFGKNDTSPGDIDVIKWFRAGEDFEKLRLRTEKANKRPKVFLLTIGNLAMRKARASFSGNFFACAGYAVIDNLGFETVEEGVKEALKVGADIVVICSSDDEYKELAPKTHQLVNNRAILVVAGAPACMEELKSTGIEHFIHMKSNVLETLLKFHELLNIN